jgi:hypothetical protein
LIANATRNPVGQGTRLEARSSLPTDLPVVAFDKELILLQGSVEESQSLFADSIRYHTMVNGLEALVLDVRNLHCDVSKWNHQLVATITILGALTNQQLRDWTSSNELLHWWRDQESLTLLLLRKNIDDMVRKIHTALYPNV